MSHSVFNILKRNIIFIKLLLFKNLWKMILIEKLLEKFCEEMMYWNDEANF